jgi:(1->4)-alpha-D-glucan 1-alpha-D-glucosylmutase
VRPTSTYRLQFRSEFGFRDAAAIVPYLADLGVSHVYCSPVLQAAPGSTHGYDVVDHSRLSADLGGEAGWQELVAACRARGLGIVIDIVPNHMAVPNPQYDDVVKHGRASAFAHWFDIDWEETERSGDLVYRRFFDVSSLIGVRVEEPDVFAATHAKILELVRADDVDGLRIDHPDGLADPRGYLERLAKETNGIWTVVEKILEPGEDLPTSWPCSGTTGYDAILSITHLLLDPSGREPLTEIYARTTGETDDFETVVDQSKRYVVEHVLTPEVDRLERELGDRTAIVERLVETQVYRVYTGEPDNVRFEQTTGPVMAKGVEDTAFYRYFRLTALNEVGGNPGAFGMTVNEWHEWCQRLQSTWPDSMTTLTTHDTKRTEDVRARLLALAEMPEAWADAVHTWQQATAHYAAAIDANTQYLFWQTLIGAWPLTRERMQAYLDKATHEAKRQTNWIDRNEEYDAAVQKFAADVFADEVLLKGAEDWMREHLDEPGLSNTLAQKLLQLTMPGVPDVYQGQELVEPALVDPDNRRPVDYDRRRKALAAYDEGAPTESKLRVTASALRLRRERPASFDGSYTPLHAQGSAAGHAVAYLRGADVIAVVTRLPMGLAECGGWGDTTLSLPPGSWVDRLSGRAHTGRAPLSEMLATLPVALLVHQQG